MAANTGQGRQFIMFLVGFTVACAGIAAISTGFGKILLVAGIAILAGSMMGFLKLKPLEGKSPMKSGAGAMKALGALLALVGWGVTLFGMHIVDSTGGRMVMAIVGIAVSLVGIVYVLPTAFNKNALWK